MNMGGTANRLQSFTLFIKFSNFQSTILGTFIQLTKANEKISLLGMPDRNCW